MSVLMETNAKVINDRFAMENYRQRKSTGMGVDGGKERDGREENGEKKEVGRMEGREEGKGKEKEK